MEPAEAVAIAEQIADEVFEDLRQGSLSRDRLTARIVALLLKHAD